MNCKNTIDELIDKADKLALNEVERLARIDLLSNSETHYFMMAMGSYFFSDKTNKILHNYNNKELDDFINRYDRMLKLTGSAMTFTAKGDLITDW